MCGRETIEVTTFRATAASEPTTSARPTSTAACCRDNVFGNMAEDAARRDFTINALYYDPVDARTCTTTTAAWPTCKKRVLRMIGDPETRFREDPVRMLRAARFAAKLGFHIDPATARADRDAGAAARQRPARRASSTRR